MNLEVLNKHLFDALDRLSDENLKGESLKEEIYRASAVGVERKSSLAIAIPQNTSIQIWEWVMQSVKNVILENTMTKQIDIKELIPYLKQGWVAMDKSGRWYWYDMSIIPAENHWVFRKGGDNICPLANIKPVSDWTKSLIKVDGDE